LVLNYIRLWDRQAADRVDIFIANSQAVRQRISKYYKSDSTVIYPPVNTELYNLSPELVDEKLKSENYFLIGCRLAPYKRVDIVIEAFKEMPAKKLKVFGAGIDLQRLKKIAASAPNIEFIGRIEDPALAKLYRNAVAFIHPQEEDFGITVVEAMACGTPVIAYRKGGALETIIENQTGIFFDEQTAPAVKKAVASFNKSEFDEKIIRAQAEKFSTENFKQNIKNLLKKNIKNF
jgi:glycosyltransferase involved in cell wall biosynthesis